MNLHKNIACWKDIDHKVAQSYEQMKELQKEIANLQNQMFALKAKDWANDIEDWGAIHVLIKEVEGMDAKALKDIVSNTKAQDEKVVCFFVNKNHGKLVFVAGAGKEAVAKGVHAGKLVKAAAQICQGNGGGKPDMAQAGGKDASKVEEALENLKASLHTFA